MKRMICLLQILSILLGLTAGCSAQKNIKNEAPDSDTDEVTIKIIQNKVEIADVLAKMEYDYKKEFPGVNLKFITFGGGTDYDSALLTKFQSGDVPDIFINEGYAKLEPWIEKSEDLSDQPWVGDIIDGAAEPVKRDGKIYGMPVAIEGFGFAYNKAIFAKAGITQLPNTLSSLEEACKKLKNAGYQPFSNTYAEWWVLGMHNFNLPLVHQEDPQKFIDDIASGKSHFKDSTIAKGWLELLDLTVRYGQKNPTSSGDYFSSFNEFATGRAAMIQQGNWIQPDLDKVAPNLDVGFIPMPVSNSPEDKISAGIPNFWIVNKDSKVKDQVKAWLNWMVNSETGRRYMTQELKFIPAFKSIKPKDLKGLNAGLSEYISRNKTYSWEFPRLPSGTSVLIGSSMMKYIGNQISQDKLLDEIDKAIVVKSTKMYD